jgi:hypothetical protein
VDDNYFPYCLGLVTAGVQSQHIKMHNAKCWAESVVLPDMDCCVGRDRGGEYADCDSSMLPLVEVVDALRRPRGAPQPARRLLQCLCLLLQYLLESCSRGGEGKQWRTCATRDYEPRPVWTSLPITH